MTSLRTAAANAVRALSIGRAALVASLAVAAAAAILDTQAHAAAPPAQDPITVFAAASLTEALTELARRFATDTGGTLRLSFASSSTLARQIENGAPAGLFFSADEAWMEYLAARGRVVRDTWQRPIANELVLAAAATERTPAPQTRNPAVMERTPQVAHAEREAMAPLINQDFDLRTRLGGGRLAVGDPDHVPAGRYAQQALEHLGLWEVARPRLARAENVRAALALVERGEAPLAIVYATDLRVARDVRVLARFPATSHAPILYSLAVLAGHDDARTRAALAFLTSRAALQVFAAHGFRIP